MRCPYCKSSNDKVIDSRSADDNFAIRRRRECLECNRRYTTYERIEETPLRVLKKNGDREPFDRAKVLSGLRKACEKRPLASEDLENITSKIERSIHEVFDREVQSSYIGELVMRELKEADTVAFVRFASVFREYRNLSEFIEEIGPLLDEERRTKETKDAAEKKRK